MKQLRLRANKRAEQVAVELDIAVSTVRNWDQLKNMPRMTPKDMKRLMQVYKCSFEELLQAQEEMERKQYS